MDVDAAETGANGTEATTTSSNGAPNKQDSPALLNKLKGWGTKLGSKKLYRCVCYVSSFSISCIFQR